MTLEKFGRALIKHWWLIIICFLAVGAGAYLGSKSIKPAYQSLALVQVTIRSNNNLVDYNSLLASDQLVQTEAILATSDSVLREVAQHYQNLSVEQLAKEVTAAPKLNTQLFEIDVQDSSPTRAAALTNDIAETLIKQQLYIFNVRSGQEGDFLRIVQPALPVFTPVQPNKTLNTLAGLLIGLLLGMLLVVLFELLDKRVRSPEALCQLLGWPVIATISHSSKKDAVFNPTDRNPNVEAYSILRMNIGFSTIEHSQHSIVVTSASSHEGKSTVAANLAIFMANVGKTTLLIDADLRSPTIQQMFELSTDKMGLSNAILSFRVPTTANASPNHKSLTFAMSESPPNSPSVTHISLEPFIHTVNIPNLYVMPSGPLPPNPSELLDSKAMQRLFTALSNCGAEVMIFDTPPLLGFSDARILASKADGTLVVVDITRANKKKLEQVKTFLAQVGAYVLGSVVNKQRPRHNDTIKSYFHSSDQKQDKKSLGTKHTNSTAIPPATSNASETQPEQDELSDYTIKLVNGNTAKRATVYPVQSETQS